MYENKIITEPKWKSWIVQTTTPLFTPDQCRQIIECGRKQPPQPGQIGSFKEGKSDTNKRVTTISWIPVKEMSHMYQDLNAFIQRTNENNVEFFFTITKAEIISKTQVSENQGFGAILSLVQLQKRFHVN